MYLNAFDHHCLGGSGLAILAARAERDAQSRTELQASASIFRAPDLCFPREGTAAEVWCQPCGTYALRTRLNSRPVLVSLHADGPRYGLLCAERRAVQVVRPAAGDERCALTHILTCLFNRISAARLRAGRGRDASPHADPEEGSLYLSALLFPLHHH
jgi:hypothetical protein